MQKMEGERAPANLIFNLWKMKVGGGLELFLRSKNKITRVISLRFLGLIFIWLDELLYTHLYGNGE